MLPKHIPDSVHTDPHISTHIHTHTHIHAKQNMIIFQFSMQVIPSEIVNGKKIGRATIASQPLDTQNSHTNCLIAIYAICLWWTKNWWHCKWNYGRRCLRHRLEQKQQWRMASEAPAANRHANVWDDSRWAIYWVDNHKLLFLPLLMLYLYQRLNPWMCALSPCGIWHQHSSTASTQINKHKCCLRRVWYMWKK